MPSVESFLVVFVLVLNKFLMFDYVYRHLYGCCICQMYFENV